MSITPRARHRMTRLVIGVALGAALVTGTVSPAAAESPASPPPAGSASLGAFGLVGGLSGAFSERDGGFGFEVPAGGLRVLWDSRAAGSNRYGLGYGWSWPVSHVQTEGGVRVFPASGGVFEADSTHPTGLASYGDRDLVFEQRAGTLSGRAGGPAVEYAFVLRELGGEVTYFSADGDPVVTVTASGRRTDWRWGAPGTHRLEAVIDHDEVVTTIDRAGRAGGLEIERGSNLPAEPGQAPPVWFVETDGSTVRSVTGPMGDALRFAYDGEAQVITSIHAPTGGETRLEWRALDDGTTRIERVSTLMAGETLATRTWSGDVAAPGAWAESADFTTTVTDGDASVISAYEASGLLTNRTIVVATPAGAQVTRDERLTYPAIEAPADASAPASARTRPSVTETVFHDSNGATRTETTSFAYDEFGRTVRTTGPDGTVVETEYDASLPGEGAGSVGLPVLERMTAPDGTVIETRTSLNEARSAAEVVERWEGRPGTDGTLQLHPVERTEQTVSADGVVSEQRRVPQTGDGAVQPAVVTRATRAVDLGAGTVTQSETTLAGTPGEATTSEVRSLRHGGVIVTTDALGNRATRQYDAAGRAVAAVDASGRVTQTEYDSARTDGRNVSTVTGPDGVSVITETDALGRVTRIADDVRDGEPTAGHVRVVETRDYAEPGVVRVTDAWGAQTTTRTDVHGREVAVIDGSGVTRVTRYDDVANTVTTGVSATGDLDDAEQTTTSRMDAGGRATDERIDRVDGAPGTATETVYDGAGRQIASNDGLIDLRIDTDDRGNAATTTLTPVPRADSSADSPALVAEKRFDGFGTPVEKTLSDGRGRRSGGASTVDGLDRVVTETDQTGRVTAYDYTPDGLVSRVAAGSGQVLEHEYDPVTRALVSSVTRSSVGAEVHTAYEHNQTTGRITAVFDPADRDGTVISYEYDAHGNQTSVTYPDGRSIAFRYDAHGRRSSMTDAAGMTSTYTHDRAGRILAVEQRDDEGAPVAEVGYDYDGLGRISAVRRGNGVVTTTTYTSASEIEREHTTRDGATLSEREYAYDEHGRLTHRVDTTAEPGDATALTTTATTYAYDAFDRLTRSTERDGGLRGQITRDTTYDLSVSGDVLSERVMTRPGSADETTVVRAFEYTALGELAAVTTSRSTAAQPEIVDVERREQRYDAAGNRVEAVDGTRTAYDAANRPVLETAADGTETSFGYWADGTRRERASGADATTFYWDGATMVNDLHADPATGAELGAASYLIGMARHARTVATPDGALDTRYTGTDRHGNVTDLTAHAGELVERYEYADYGVQRRLPGNIGPVDELHRMPFGYSGEYTDPSGRQHLAARTYEPPTMRFTAADTAKLHNLYAYADLNPITKIDPTGHDAAEDVMRFWLPEVVVPVLVGMVLSFSIAGAVMTPYLQAAHVTGLLMQVGAVAGVVFHEVNTRLLPTPLVDPSISGGVALGVAGAAFVGGLASGLIGEAVRALPRLARRIASNVNWARYRLQRMMTRQGTTTVVDPPPVVHVPVDGGRTAAQMAFDGPPGGALTEVSYTFANPGVTRAKFMRSLFAKFEIDPSEVAAEIRIIKNART